MDYSMPVPYNLRSTQRNKKRNCYLQSLTPERGLPKTFDPTVCLERLKFLDRYDTKSSRFYLENGKITIKQSKSVLINKKSLLKFVCVVAVLITSYLYCSDFLHSNGIDIAKKCGEIYPSFQSWHFITKKLQKNIKNILQYKPEKSVKKNRQLNLKPKFSEANSTVMQDSFEIRQLVKDYFGAIEKKNKIQYATKSHTFIEEQCKRDVQDYSDVKKENISHMTFHDLEYLADYALESQGASIITVFDTELYGTITVKFLNVNLWPGLSHFFLKYLKSSDLNGPNSILIPWKKPGDCWAFKGSYGRAQIKLSKEIVITAVTMEHLPKELFPDKNIHSAPKKFSIFGIKEPGSENNRIYYGSYEYNITGPPAQTFFIEPRLKIPFSAVELVIESNHGNEMFTCIYKIRIHGQR